MEVLTRVRMITFVGLLCIAGISMVSGTSKNRNLGTCEQLVLSGVCSDAGLPYTSTRLPNDFNHLDVRTAEDILLGEYLPLFNSGCSDYIRPFVCSIFFPECTHRRREQGIRPCKELCENAREKCQQTFASYGQNWPAQFDCEQFEPYRPKRSRKKGRDNCFNYLPPPPEGNNQLRRPATHPTIQHQSHEQERTLQGRNGITTTIKPIQADFDPTAILPSIPPLIVNPPGNHLVEEFGTVTLKCLATGPPPIEYSWNRLDGPMPEEKIMKEETFGDEGILVIVNMTTDDAGEYLCTAENYEGMVDSVAVVTIYANVHISPFEHVINVGESDRIQLECNATGYPKPHVYWRRNSYPDEILTTSNVLIIEAARSDDMGTYICEASNAYSTASHQVQVVVSVSIWVSIGNSFYLKYGKTATIECVLEGYPAIEVTWFNEDQNRPVPNERFTNMEVFLMDKHIYRVTSNLLFHNVTNMDVGKYSCYGSNSAGQYHRSTDVFVTGEECPLPGGVENSDLEIEGIYHGSRQTYTCKKSYTLVGAASIQCVNGNYDEQPPHCFADCGMQTNLRGTYGYITHGSTGKLVCYEHLGYYLGGSGNVSCRDGSIVGDAKCYKPPSFQERPVDGYVIEHQDIILKCIPDTDDSIVTWYRGENEVRDTHLDAIKFICQLSLADSLPELCETPQLQVTNNRPSSASSLVLIEDNKDSVSRISKTMNGSVLTIKRATFQDAGPYTCKIANPIGTATAHARLSVIGANHLPHIVKPLDHIVEYAGHNVQLRCENKGDPTPNVTWFFEASPITASHSDMLIVDSTLLISRIEAQHTGRYTCVATNQYGTDYANCTLTVIEPPTEPPPQPERIEYMKDPESQLRALLMCPYGGKAEEAVKWTFDDGDLTSTLRRYTVTNRRLIIHDANESDNGVYTCIVHTTKGMQIYSTILTITSSDSIPPRGLASGEEEVLSDSGFTDPRPAESPEFRTTTIATTPEITESPKIYLTKPTPKQTKDVSETVHCNPCPEAPQKIKPRRLDINDTGIPYYFRGWVDVQGQGAANDYCRLINPTPNQMMLACALAGTHGQSQYNYVSTSNLDPGYRETSYMKDEDGDGRDDYCRCVGAGREMYVWCMKASVDGFAGKTEGGANDDGTGPSQYTFVAPGPRSLLRKCRKRKVDPFFGLPVR